MCYCAALLVPPRQRHLTEKIWAPTQYLQFPYTFKYRTKHHGTEILQTIIQRRCLSSSPLHFTHSGEAGLVAASTILKAFSTYPHQIARSKARHGKR